LTKLREIYGLSAQKMAQIFGFGINTYSNYEKGEMPTSANAKLISSGKNPQIFLSFLEQSKDQFPAKKYQKLEAIAKSQQISIEENDTVCNFNWYSVPNKFTGYCIPNPDKVANLLLYFITECKPEYNDKLKLNKMLFYADFLNYKSTGKSISGISYRAIPYGPVPSKYDFIFAHFTEQNEIIESVFIKAEDSKINECFKSIKPFDLSIFTEEELKTIRHIIELFKNTPSWDLVELSHTEKACIELNKEREIISYQEYAFDLSLEL
jgi:transcriptional regulator with XRE-family HTH domain